MLSQIAFCAEYQNTSIYDCIKRKYGAPFQLKLASIQTFKSRNGKLSCFVLPAIFSKKHIND